MANCNSCNGGCGNGTRVGALNSLCRNGCRSPYYTGPCPPAPCSCGCGNNCASGCRNGCSAAVIDLNEAGCGTACGCGGCNGCSACGCNACNGARGYSPCKVCGGCNNSGGGCNTCDACSTCANDWNWQCETCGCANCGTDHCSNCGHPWHGCHGGYGVFTCGGPLKLSAGGSVNFESRCADAGDFSVSYGSILIRRPGLYYVHVTADIPKNTDADTVMRLELDGRNIAPPELAITTTCGCGTSNHSGCGIIRACSGSILKLTTLRDLCIDCTTAQPIFTIFIIPIHHCCNH